MLNTEMLSKKFGGKIASELNLDNDSKEVISYGIFAIIQMLYNIALVILFGAIFNVLIESLIASFTISILRKSSGGTHASSEGICAFLGTFVAIVIGLIAKLDIGLSSVIFIGSITFIYSYYIILKLAPVDNPTKPIRTEKKKNRLKKSSIFILSTYLMIISISIILYFNTKIDRLLIYSICIIGGVIWQVLSLTKLGHRMVKLIDTFFNNILKIGGKNNEKS